MNSFIKWFNDNPVPTWFLKTGAYLVVVVVGVMLARKFIRKILATDGKDHKKQTLFPIFKEILYALVYFFAFCIVLEIFGVSTTPIWTVASAVSVAVGFGAQQVVKDIFSGFLILFEGQYVIGDIVEINGDTGEVENISLRTTELRDGVDGSLHIISNGEIRTVTNLTKKYMIAVVDLPIAYEEDLDGTLTIMKDLASKYVDQGNLLEKVSVLGVRMFDDRNLVVRITCKTKTGQNWAVERNLRLYFKTELEKQGIFLPHSPIYVPLSKVDNV